MNHEQVSFIRIASLEALALTHALARREGMALRYLAGGTDLMVELRSPGQGLCLNPAPRACAPCLLADLSGWEELRRLTREADGTLSIGALCTHAALADALPPWAQVLAQAARSVGSPQIRIRATVGGNCANGAPAADTPPALVLLGAEAELAVCTQGGTERVRIPLSDYLRHREAYRDALILRLIVPEPAAAAHRRFYKQGRREALAISTVSLAVEAACCAGGDGLLRVERLRFVTGAVTGAPFAYAAPGPARLSGRADCMDYAAGLAAQAAEAMDQAYGPRASRGYKRQVITGMLYEFLTQREGGDGPWI